MRTTSISLALVVIAALALAASACDDVKTSDGDSGGGNNTAQGNNANNANNADNSSTNNANSANNAANGATNNAENNAAAATCSCNTPGVTFEIVAGCAQGFDDATECSGYHSVFCFREGGPGDACPELPAFSDMAFDNGTSFAAFDCEIAIACP